MNKVAYNGAVRLPPNLLGLVRGLRFRLTLSYFAIFAVLLAAIGLYFRASLRETLDDRMREIVEQEWAAVRGYLRIENEVPVWYFDAKDPEESSFVERLQRIILIADNKGKVLTASNGYLALGVENSQVLQGRFLLGMSGNKDYIIRSDQPRGSKHNF